MNRIIQLAKKLSYKSDHRAHKLGCVIVNKNKIISLGWNRIKTHPKSPHKFKSIHAEFHAILGVDERELNGATVYIYREQKNGKLGKARPCSSCWKMLENVGISEIIYSDYDGMKRERI